MNAALRTCVPLAALLATVAGPAQAQQPEPGLPFVTFQYMVVPSDVLVTLNGFPILKGKHEQGGSGGGPVNVYVVPTGNRLEVRFDPIEVPGAAADPEAPPFSAQLSLDAPGSYVSLDGPGNLLNIDLSGAEGARTAAHAFDLPDSVAAAFTAGQRLAALPVVDDEAALRAYALRLLGLFAAKDTAGILAEMQPKLDDTAAAFGMPADVLAASFEEALADPAWADLHTDVDAADVVLTPWAGGRVWEITLQGDRPLIAAGTEESMTFMEIFVGRVDGALRVVR